MDDTLRLYMEETQEYIARLKGNLVTKILISQQNKNLERTKRMELNSNISAKYLQVADEGLKYKSSMPHT